jgi:hypothetical protein
MHLPGDLHRRGNTFSRNTPLLDCTQTRGSLYILLTPPHRMIRPAGKFDVTAHLLADP